MYRIRVLSLWLLLQQRTARAPKLSIEGDVDTDIMMQLPLILIPLQLPLIFFLDDGDVNNEIGFPCNVEALNIDVATLTPSRYSNVPSLGREPR